MALRLKAKTAKSGRQHGNGILYGGSLKTYHMFEPDKYQEIEVFYVETDFGNHMTLNWDEVMEMFEVVGWANYDEWRRDRDALREHPRLDQQDMAIIPPGLLHGS